MKAPQIVMLCFLVLNLWISLTDHGKPKGRYSFWASLVGVAVYTGLLIWGGFFG